MRANRVDFQCFSTCYRELLRVLHRAIPGLRALLEGGQAWIRCGRTCATRVATPCGTRASTLTHRGEGCNAQDKERRRPTKDRPLEGLVEPSGTSPFGASALSCSRSTGGSTDAFCPAPESMSHDGNFFGKLSSGWSNKLNNFGALINDPSVREKAGELLRSTAKNLGAQGQQQLGRVAQMGAGFGGHVAQIGAQVKVAHRARVKNRLDRQKQSNRQSHVKSGECDLQVGQLLYDAVPIYMRTQLWKSLLIHNETESCEVNSNVCDALYYQTLLQTPLRSTDTPKMRGASFEAGREMQAQPEGARSLL
ncbi:hypothetical protein CYMTET_8249 [Cymbomonas tetramitiformis]|uniref:Uncharacterized protein n=1 Tax=Cymbomonas tetramitiformis TaxID=36881 RepID=A0AAE0GTV4_9CHLO|nr:hypothetical protein CYMTET_8249 [Cymbomonas tetramitiformis]KAK3284083.1 hypothetical protein CYMTET_8249 [Cymbomonas tetramitiformis]